MILEAIGCVNGFFYAYCKLSAIILIHLISILMFHFDIWPDQIHMS